MCIVLLYDFHPFFMSAYRRTFLVTIYPASEYSLHCPRIRASKYSTESLACILAYRLALSKCIHYLHSCDKGYPEHRKKSLQAEVMRIWKPTYCFTSTNRYSTFLARSGQVIPPSLIILAYIRWSNSDSCTNNRWSAHRRDQLGGDCLLPSLLMTETQPFPRYGPFNLSFAHCRNYCGFGVRLCDCVGADLCFVWKIGWWKLAGILFFSCEDHWLGKSTVHSTIQ